MKKKFFAVVMVMSVWASGFYALGRHHGVTKGPMETPSISIKWNGEEKPAAEVKEEKKSDSVAISYDACSEAQNASVTVAK